VTSETIDGPGGYNVDLAAGRGLQQPVEPGSLVAPVRAADPVVGKLFDHCPSRASADRLDEAVALVLDRLTSVDTLR
jgi:hypothetical protein